MSNYTAVHKGRTLRNLKHNLMSIMYILKLWRVSFNTNKLIIKCQVRAKPGENFSLARSVSIIYCIWLYVLYNIQHAIHILHPGGFRSRSHCMNLRNYKYLGTYLYAWFEVVLCLLRSFFYYYLYIISVVFFSLYIIIVCILSTFSSVSFVPLVAVVTEFANQLVFPFRIFKTFE